MDKKFIVYQILTRAFGNTECCKFNDITAQRIDEIKKLSVSYIWYTGIIEHATCADYSAFGISKDNPQIVKGAAGSPYAIKDYYDVDPDLAVNVSERMAEFEALIQRTHEAGVKVIIDFVPNHVAREYKSDVKPQGIEDLGESDDKSVIFSGKNNFYYIPGKKLDLSKIIDKSVTNNLEQPYNEYPAKATGNNRFTEYPDSNDWYETVKINYGIDILTGEKHFTPQPKTWKMMLDILFFWVSKGIDGFRCDMAGMVPVEFWSFAISALKKINPALIFIGELYETDKYEEYLKEGGFDYLYDKVGMYDTLRAINCSNGKVKASAISEIWSRIDKIQNRMLNFLENHDEQRLASAFYLNDPFKAIPALTVSLMLNKAPFMIYAGQELGEKGMQSEGYSKSDGRTSIYDYCTIPAIANFLKDELRESEKELYGIYIKLCNIAITERAIKEGDTYDLEYANLNNPYFSENNPYVFARRTRKSINYLNDNDELIIIAVDFCNKAETKSIDIDLPDEFFKYWDIKQNHEYEYIILTNDFDRLSSESPTTKNDIYKTVFAIGTKFKMPLCKYGISIIKINLDS